MKEELEEELPELPELSMKLEEEEELQANEAKNFISRPFLKAVAGALEVLSPCFKANLGYLVPKNIFP